MIDISIGLAISLLVLLVGWIWRLSIVVTKATEALDNAAEFSEKSYHCITEVNVSMDKFEFYRGRQEHAIDHMEMVSTQVEQVLTILAKLHSLLELLSIKTNELHTWHALEDEDGVKIWYVRASLEKSIKELGKDIKTSYKELADAIKEVVNINLRSSIALEQINTRAQSIATNLSGNT